MSGDEAGELVSAIALVTGLLSVMDLLGRGGVLDELGADQVYGNLLEAVRDKIDAQPPESSS